MDDLELDISSGRRIGWFRARYHQGEGLDELELDIFREKDWMV